MDEIAVLVAETVAFLIVLFVLYRYVWPILARMAAGRQDEIQQQVDDSEQATRKLADAEASFESALAEARGEAAKIRDDARADAERLGEELRAQADREVERIRQRGEEQLTAQREQTVRRLRAELGGLSMQLAERIIVESLSADDRKRATVDRFLDELDGMVGAQGRAGHDQERTDEERTAEQGTDEERTADEAIRPVPGAERRTDGAPVAGSQPGVAGRRHRATRPAGRPRVGVRSRTARLRAVRRAAPAGGEAGPAPAPRRPDRARRRRAAAWPTSCSASSSSRPTLDVVSDLVSSRWSRSPDLSRRVEELGRRATLGVAEKDGSLDEVEDQLFRFGRVLDREPELNSLLTDHATPPDKRLELLHGCSTRRSRRSPRRCSAPTVGRRAGAASTSRPRSSPSWPRPAATATWRTSARRCALSPDQEQRLADVAEPAVRTADLAAGRAGPGAARRPARAGRRRGHRRQRGGPAGRRAQAPAATDHDDTEQKETTQPWPS